jgi:hypothetical protein
MARSPIRRAQIIRPFGVGAIVVSPQGVSLMGAGLDHWFETDTGATENVNEVEYRVEEWRLERALNVSHFRLPPDFRRPDRFRPSVNEGLTIPYVRFPTWHRCQRCNLLMQLPTSAQGRIQCPECVAKYGRKAGYLVQVSTIAMCKLGHIQDFPYSEWVHRDLTPSCHGPIRLFATGAATAANEKIVCDACGMHRTLGGVLQSDGENTVLSLSLVGGGVLYTCRGEKPWLGRGIADPCDEQLHGALRAATNVYFPLVRSSLYIPRGSEDAPEDLIETLRTPPVSTLVHLLRTVGQDMDPRVLRGQYFDAFRGFTDEQIKRSLNVIEAQLRAVGSIRVSGDDEETAFRREEFAVLSERREDSQLVIRQPDMTRYEGLVRRLFDRVMLIEKLRETRVLWGFNRLLPDSPVSMDNRKHLLWKDYPELEHTWLPAYSVFGEGIFLRFDEDRLSEWERSEEVVRRIDRLVDRYERVVAERGGNASLLSARLVLVHTLAHLMINRLAFSSGYSSASLRERLFVTSNPSGRMAGLLLYTADGDSEGTLGGLVRIGKPGNLEPVLQEALEEATWCSGDPVCMEIGGAGGQGPDSCNCAACYRCALVAETSCELQNRFLDRAMWVGTLTDPAIGLWNRLMDAIN